MAFKIRTALNTAKKWFNTLNIKNEVVALVGNKCDLENNREIDYIEASEYARQNNMLYFEVSAKTGYNIDKLFNTVSELALNTLQKNNSYMVNDDKLILDNKNTLNYTSNCCNIL